MAGEPARPGSGGNAGDAAGPGQRHGGAPRGGRPGCAGRARLASVRSRLTGATNKGSTPPGAPPAPHFGAGAAADAKDLGASPPKRRQCSGDAVETKKNDATTRAQKCAAGTRCAARQKPRSGLFDIVKNDDGRRAVPAGHCNCAPRTPCAKAALTTSRAWMTPRAVIRARPASRTHRSSIQTRISSARAPRARGADRRRSIGLPPPASHTG